MKFPISSIPYKELSFGKELGKGTYGKVFSCVHNVSSNKLALKQHNGLSDEDKKKPAVMVPCYRFDSPTFWVELAIMSFMNRCGGSNVIPVHAFDVTQTTSSTMATLMTASQQTLTSLCKEGMKYADMFNVISSVAKSIKSCHFWDILHRDIKTCNILVNTTPLQIFLCDFGLSHRMLFAGQKRSVDVVTIWYRPPELLELKAAKIGRPVKKKEDVHTESVYTMDYGKEIDIWSFGMLVLHMMNMGISVCRGESERQQLTMYERFLYDRTTKQSKIPHSIDTEWLQTVAPNNPAIVNDPNMECYLVLLRGCLQYEPSARMTINQVYQVMSGTFPPKPPMNDMLYVTATPEYRLLHSMYTVPSLHTDLHVMRMDMLYRMTFFFLTHSQVITFDVEYIVMVMTYIDTYFKKANFTTPPDKYDFNSIWIGVFYNILSTMCEDMSFLFIDKFVSHLSKNNIINLHPLSVSEMSTRVFKQTALIVSHIPHYTSIQNTALHFLKYTYYPNSDREYTQDKPFIDLMCMFVEMIKYRFAWTPAEWAKLIFEAVSCDTSVTHSTLWKLILQHSNTLTTKMGEKNDILVMLEHLYPTQAPLITVLKTKRDMQKIIPHTQSEIRTRDTSS